MIDSTFYIHLFRFYSKCLAPPYSELGWELQHIFRQMEVACTNELDEQLASHCLDILNYFQGEDISTLQAEFTRMFSHAEDEEPLVSILFTSYGAADYTDSIMDDMYDSLVEISFDESPNSVINFLDYFSYLSESGEVAENLEKFTNIILPFSQQFYTVANINFYKEVAKGLSELCAFFSDDGDI